MALCTPPFSRAASGAGRGKGGSQPRRARRERHRWDGDLCGEPSRRLRAPRPPHRCSSRAAGRRRPGGADGGWSRRLKAARCPRSRSSQHIDRRDRGHECDMPAWMSHCPALRRPWVMSDQTAKEKTQMETQTSSAPRSAPRNLNLALAVIALAQLMVVLDTAIVNVALPSIQRALHFNPTDLEWVVNAYTIAFGGLLLLGGRTGDLFGRRRMFIIGALMFTAGSLAGGLATSSTFLIAARAAQGIGAAVLAPTALSLLAATFPQGAERNRALGVYSAVSAGGGAIRPLMCRLITN